MPTVKDVVVKKPSDAEAAQCRAWPIWRCEPSTFDWAYTEKETCLLIEGKVTVSVGVDERRYIVRAESLGSIGRLPVTSGHAAERTQVQE